MGSRCKIGDILQLAVQAEEVGEAFYRKLASLNQDDAVKKILLFFADEEHTHRQTFRRIAGEARNKDAEKDFAVDVPALLREGIGRLRDSGFQSPDTDLRALDVRHCLRMALEIEQETVRIYRQIQNALTGHYNDTLHKIIAEENQHAQMIQGVLDAKLGGAPQAG